LTPGEAALRWYLSFSAKCKHFALGGKAKTRVCPRAALAGARDQCLVNRGKEEGRVSGVDLMPRHRRRAGARTRDFEELRVRPSQRGKHGPTAHTLGGGAQLGWSSKLAECWSRGVRMPRKPRVRGVGDRRRCSLEGTARVSEVSGHQRCGRVGTTRVREVSDRWRRSSSQEVSEDRSEMVKGHVKTDHLVENAPVAWAESIDSRRHRPRLRRGDTRADPV
jgi:hypothetical protein